MAVYQLKGGGGGSSQRLGALASSRIRVAAANYAANLDSTVVVQLKLRGCMAVYDLYIKSSLLINLKGTER